MLKWKIWNLTEESSLRDKVLIPLLDITSESNSLEELILRFLSKKISRTSNFQKESQIYSAVLEDSSNFKTIIT